jgi:hypothetical protein
MTAYTGDQPLLTTATSTTFTFNNISLFSSYPNNNNSYTAQTYVLLLTQYYGDSITSFISSYKSTTSTNLQAYTKYPKTP